MGDFAATLSDITPSTVTSVLGFATGVASLLGWDGAVYLLAAGTIAAIAGGVINAWLFLVDSAADAQVRLAAG